MSKKERFYVLVYNEFKDKYAIVEKETGRQISKYYDDFYFEEFSIGKSNFYKVINNGRQAIFGDSPIQK